MKKKTFIWGLSLIISLIAICILLGSLFSNLNGLLASALCFLMSCAFWLSIYKYNKPPASFSEHTKVIYYRKGDIEGWRKRCYVLFAVFFGIGVVFVLVTVVFAIAGTPINIFGEASKGING